MPLIVFSCLSLNLTVTASSLKIRALQMNTAFTVRIQNLYRISQLSPFVFNMILFPLLCCDGPDFGDPEKKALIVVGPSCQFV